MAGQFHDDIGGAPHRGGVDDEGAATSAHTAARKIRQPRSGLPLRQTPILCRFQPKNLPLSKAHAMKHFLTLLIGLVSLPALAAGPIYNVRDYGAVGDGRTLDHDERPAILTEDVEEPGR